MPALATKARSLNQRARARATERRAVAALAVAPVRTPSFIVRLDPNAPEVDVDTLGFSATLRGYGGADDYGHEAALAAHLASEEPYGPIVRRAVRVAFMGGGTPDQDLILVGRLSAVERTVPDRETRQVWAAAGVLVSGKGAPVVRQMENR